jgi:hypothetical protein
MIRDTAKKDIEDHHSPQSPAVILIELCSIYLEEERHIRMFSQFQSFIVVLFSLLVAINSFSLQRSQRWIPNNQLSSKSENSKSVYELRALKEGAMESIAK